MVDYKDKFTFDGRIKPVNGVTPKKVEAANRLLTAALRGDRAAGGLFESQLTTSDLQFNAAYLVTQELIPQFDAAERVWSQIASTRVVPNFNAVQLYSLFGNVTGAGVDANGGAVRVPEAAPYPHVTITGQESLYAKIAKNGFRFSFTWESAVNDVVGFFEALPQELLSVALDTEEREVFDALIDGTTAAATLDGGTLPDGTVVPPNAPVSPEAIWQAIIELQNREVNGRKVGRVSGYNVVVGTGVGEFLRWHLERQIIQVQDGLVTYGPGDRSALNGVTIVESPRITGSEWYLLPKPGTLRRPVLELGRLRGYETPELRVNNATGVYNGGGAVSPFEGSFDNDSVDYRFRYVAGGILWDDTFIVHSDGSGEA